MIGDVIAKDHHKPAKKEQKDEYSTKKESDESGPLMVVGIENLEKPFEPQPLDQDSMKNRLTKFQNLNARKYIDKNVDIEGILNRQRNNHSVEEYQRFIMDQIDSLNKIDFE